MSLAVFYVLVSVTSILLYVILFLWWTPPKLRLTMVGAMLAAFAASFLLLGWGNRQVHELLPRFYHLLDGRIQSLASGLIASIILFGVLTVPLLIPRIRAALTPGNGVTLPLALGLGASISHSISIVQFSITPEVLELIADIRPEWIAVSALFSPVQSTARYALAVSFLSLAWPNPQKCAYAVIAGILVLVFMTGTKVTYLASTIIDWDNPAVTSDQYPLLYQAEIFLMLGLTILGLWIVDGILRKRRFQGKSEHHEITSTHYSDYT